MSVVSAATILAAVASAPAGATSISVSTQAAHRDALDDLSGDASGPHRITLTAAGSFERASA